MLILRLFDLLYNRKGLDMDEFKVISIMNEATKEVLKDKNENYERNLQIEEFLKDEAFFFKIDKLTAYEILKDVGVRKEQLETVYNKLISQKVFYDLLYRGKIDVNDKNLIVKYKIVGKNDLFKK